MIDACWNSIGVRGDQSCPELERHVHCRNCPTYEAGAAEVLRQAAAESALAERSHHFAQPKPTEEPGAESAVIFRVAGEWLALPTSVVKEIVEPGLLHSLPHRRSGTVLGVTNVRGELVAAVSLSALLGLRGVSDGQAPSNGRSYPRQLVLSRDAVRVACIADDVHGVHRFRPSKIKQVPATLAAASAKYSKGLLAWNNASVSVLDEQLLFYSMRRCLA